MNVKRHLYEKGGKGLPAHLRDEHEYREGSYVVARPRLDHRLLRDMHEEMHSLDDLPMTEPRAEIERYRGLALRRLERAEETRIQLDWCAAEDAARMLLLAVRCRAEQVADEEGYDY